MRRDSASLPVNISAVGPKRASATRSCSWHQKDGAGGVQSSSNSAAATSPESTPIIALICLSISKTGMALWYASLT
jgi:hypothetical protein